MVKFVLLQYKVNSLIGEESTMTEQEVKNLTEVTNVDFRDKKMMNDLSDTNG